ncbi:MAG: hypothetical protein U9N04_03345 [Patescibacteria group bacterium]|nr:hypothetical protein [Patescibacteria group bacterium]
MDNKNPFTAALINFFFWGLGYVYCGKRTVFGRFVFAGFIFVHLPLFYEMNWLEIPGIFTFIGHTLLSIAFAIDVIKLTKIKGLEPKKFPPLSKEARGISSSDYK